MLPTRLTQVLLGLALVLPAQALAQGDPSPSALLFGKKCAGCHSIGEGDRAGPDLLNVTKRREKKWVEEFIRNPASKFDSGDAVANGLLEKFRGMRMPEQQLTAEEMTGLLAYFDDCNAKGVCKIVSGKIKPASEATAADILAGQELFEGRRALTNGGPPCIGCHNVRDVGVVGGGTLAKDLTFVYARLGDQALNSALESTPFSLMKDIFAKAPLTQAEVYSLKAYFWKSAQDGTQPRADFNFLYAGVLGLALSIGLVGLIWAGRMRGVRQNVMNGGHR